MLWHSICRIFRHIFWHFFWHSFWHSFWQFHLTCVLTLSGILFDIYVLAFDISGSLSRIYSDILSDIPSGIRLYPAFVLTFWHICSHILSRILFGIICLTFFLRQSFWHRLCHRLCSSPVVALPELARVPTWPTAPGPGRWGKNTVFHPWPTQIWFSSDHSAPARSELQYPFLMLLGLHSLYRRKGSNTHCVRRSACLWSRRNVRLPAKHSSYPCPRGQLGTYAFLRRFWSNQAHALQAAARTHTHTSYPLAAVQWTYPTSQKCARNCSLAVCSANLYIVAKNSFRQNSPAISVFQLITRTWDHGMSEFPTLFDKYVWSISAFACFWRFQFPLSPNLFYRR